MQYRKLNSKYTISSVFESCGGTTRPRCLISLPYTISVLLFAVIAAASPTIEVRPSSDVPVGSSVEFHCLLGNNGPSITKRWEFKQQQVLASSHIKIKPTQTEHILEITSARLSDVGMYSCVVDVNGSEITASENLKVYGMG